MFNEAVQTAMHRDAEPDEEGDVTVLRAPTYKVTRSMSDAAPALSNAAIDVFGASVTVMMCWVHVWRAVKNKHSLLVIHLKKSAKSHSAPLQPRPTHTPSRRCAPCSLACFHFFFRERPLFTRPHLTLPLLSTFEPAGKSAFLSPHGVSIAAARQDICTISHQLNKPCAWCACGLCQVRSLHVLIHAGTTSTLAWEQSSSGTPPLRHCS